MQKGSRTTREGPGGPGRDASACARADAAAEPEPAQRELDPPSLSQLIDWDTLIGGALADDTAWDARLVSVSEARLDATAPLWTRRANEWQGWPAQVPNEDLLPALSLAEQLLGPGQAFVAFTCGDRLVVKHSSSSEGPAAGLSVPLDGSIQGRAALTGATVYSSEDGDALAELTELGLPSKGLLCAPIVRRTGATLGVLTVATPTPPVRTEAADQNLLAVARFALAQIKLRMQVHVASRNRSELLLSEALAAKIISMASEAVISVDEDQRIGLWNRGAEEIFGYTRDEALGKPLDLIVPTKAREQHREHVRLFLRGITDARHKGERRPVRGRRKDGEVFPAEASISKVDLGGRVILNVVMRDITDRMRSEQELARYAEELARSNAELEQFAYAASHDLKEPLRMVESYCRLLKRRYHGRLDKDADDFITFAVDGANRMRDLVDDLLSYARIGAADLQSAPVNLQTTVEGVLQSIGLAVEESGAAVVVDRLPTVLGDASQLSLVCQNLIANAIKFHDGPSPEVHISATRDDDEWVVTVADNGLGIAPEFHDQIFELFKRLHPVNRYPGTGLGLALVRRVIERHGGRTWVESAPECGARFHFTVSAVAEPGVAGNKERP